MLKLYFCFCYNEMFPDADQVVPVSGYQALQPHYCAAAPPGGGKPGEPINF